MQSARPQSLQFAFDVGHNSIGWAVLDAAVPEHPDLLGCGAVTFPTDDCLASTRRGFRRQRRHIRATRLRIARLRLLLAHLDVLTDDALKAPGCAWPWLLAARVLRGGEMLSWSELWDVLRWYAHNRGYDGNRGWSRYDVASAEDTEKEKKAGELLTAFAAKHGRAGTMAEVFCDVLGIDPLGARKSSTQRMRNLGAAFPREGVEMEVERILRAHLGVLPGLDEAFVAAVMRDHTAIDGIDYRLPARYGQRLADGTRSAGGLLFGQLVPRFENRIVARCPITFERVYQAALADGAEEADACQIAEKMAKVPAVGCVEFHRYRWAMQLANIKVATDDPKAPRNLRSSERIAVNAEMERRGFLTPTELKKAVRMQTGGAKDNLEELLSHEDAGRALVLDPVRRFIHTHELVAALWPVLGEPARKRLSGQWRRGRKVTVEELLAACEPDRAAAEAVTDRYFDAQNLKKRRKDAPLTHDDFLRMPLQVPPLNGRAPFTRKVMAEVYEFVLSTDRHPMDGRDGKADNGPLFRNEAIREAQLRRAIDEQTNNHLVRHRLKMLERLHEDLIVHYAAGDRERVGKITIEVNRELREMSGKTAQEQAKEQGQLLAHFKNVQKDLEAAYEGLGVHVGPGLIRKGRIAEDLGWACPYSGKNFDALDLLHRRVDKDHVIPRSLRPSDSLDSLVITFGEINKWKGQRTALRFVEEEQGKPVPGMENVFVKTLAAYVRDVEALEAFKGHNDDKRRKKNRKRLLLLRDYVEKEFTPGDLTRTSQLVRLGAQALQKHYLDVGQLPVITSLPGSVTGAVRKSWNLLGCLSAANGAVLDPAGKVRTKTEIRGITHLHHALDACVLALASVFLPRDGGAWALLTKRRLTAEEQRRAAELFRMKVEISADGQLRLPDLPSSLKEKVRQRLAELRVVQHLPSEMTGLPTKETVWRIFDPHDAHPSAHRLAKWLTAAKVKISEEPDTEVLITRRKRKGADADADAGGKVFHEGKVWRWVYEKVERDKLLGLDGGENGKLRAIKGGKLIADNYGMALLPNAPKGERPYRIIRFFRVWEQIEKLRAANGGKRPEILRRGQLVTFSKGKREGKVFRIIGINEDGLVRFGLPDIVRRVDKPMNYEKAQISSLLKDGIIAVKAGLCGAITPSIPPLR